MRSLEPVIWWGIRIDYLDKCLVLVGRQAGDEWVMNRRFNWILVWIDEWTGGEGRGVRWLIDWGLKKEYYLTSGRLGSFDIETLRSWGGGKRVWALRWLWAGVKNYVPDTYLVCMYLLHQYIIWTQWESRTNISCMYICRHPETSCLWAWMFCVVSCGFTPHERDQWFDCTCKRSLD